MVGRFGFWILDFARNPLSFYPLLFSSGILPPIVVTSFILESPSTDYCTREEKKSTSNSLMLFWELVCQINLKFRIFDYQK